MTTEDKKLNKPKDVTNVDRIEGYTGIAENEQYNVQTAVEVLGDFIFPKTAYTTTIDGEVNPSLVLTNTSRITNITQLKRNLASWLFAHDEDLEESEEIRGFVSSTFDTINNDAFKELLKLSIGSYLDTTGLEESTIRSLVVIDDKGKGEVLSDLVSTRLKGTAFLEKLEEKVTDSKFFNTDITLGDIKNQTPESKYFYKLSPTEVNDPIIQEVLTEMEESEETYIQSDTANLTFESLGIPIGEFVEKWLQVEVRPESVRDYIDSIKEHVLESMGPETDIESKEFKEEVAEWLEVIHNDVLQKKLTRADLANRERQKNPVMGMLTVDDVLARMVALDIINREHPEETAMEYRLLWPFTSDPNYEKEVAEPLEKIKKRYSKLLREILVSEEAAIHEELGETETTPEEHADYFAELAEGIQEDANMPDWSTNFESEEDVANFLLMVEGIEIHNARVERYKYELNGKKLKKLPGHDEIDKIITKYVENVVNKLSNKLGGIEFKEVGMKEKEVDEDFAIKVVRGTAPISREKLKKLLIKENKLFQNLDGTKSKAEILNALDDLVTVKLRQTPRTFKLALQVKPFVLDLTKASPIPKSVKSPIKNIKEKANKVTRSLKFNIDNYAVVTGDEIKISKEMEFVDSINNILDILKQLEQKLNKLGILTSEDPTQILDSTNIPQIADTINAVVSNVEELSDINIDVDNETITLSQAMISDNNDGVMQLLESELNIDDFKTMVNKLLKVANAVLRAAESEPEEEPEDEEIDTPDEEGAGEKGIEELLSEDTKTEIENEVNVNKSMSLAFIVDILQESDIENVIMRDLTEDINEFIEPILELDDDGKKQLDVVEEQEGYTNILTEIINLKNQETLPKSEEIKQMHIELRKVFQPFNKKYAEISDVTERAYKYIKNIDVLKLILDFILRHSKHSTTNIVDLYSNIDVELTHNKKDNEKTLRVHGELDYSTISKVESTSSSYDFTQTEAHGKTIKRKFIPTQQNLIRPKGAKKGIIEDRFKAKIYNELYVNILELEALLAEADQ